ncbi:sulfotransferase [Methylomagnum ishizawai]|uniref:sulfotransferase n=1 Tax=Methylomagnum ishizawai TaxID=1760988 RepID=UPI001C8158D3|nr:sulfotransferase [Methylomagnum ishizawai]
MRIVYIAGPLRGGSTVLERVLNSAPTVVALGEFDHLWRIPAQEIKCSCCAGVGLYRCEYWSEILKHARIGEKELRYLWTLEHKLVRSHFLLKMGFSLENIDQHHEVKDFLAMQFSMFDSIATLTGAKVLVDSSKSGPRAWLLATRKPVTILHLHRSAVDVMSSWSHSKIDPIWSTVMFRRGVMRVATDWAKVEQLIRLLGKQRPVLRLDYRDFVASPRAAIQRTFIGSLNEIVDTIQWHDGRTILPGDSYHSINGNSDRFAKGRIVVEPRRVAINHLKFTERLAIATLGGCLNKIYR